MHRCEETAGFFEASIATKHGFVSASTLLYSTVRLTFIWNDFCFEWEGRKEIKNMRELINLAQAFAKFIAEEA